MLEKVWKKIKPKGHMHWDGDFTICKRCEFVPKNWINYANANR